MNSQYYEQVGSRDKKKSLENNVYQSLREIPMTLPTIASQDRAQGSSHPNVKENKEVRGQPGWGNVGAPKQGEGNGGQNQGQGVKEVRRTNFDKLHLVKRRELRKK